VARIYKVRRNPHQLFVGDKMLSAQENRVIREWERDHSLGAKSGLRTNGDWLKYKNLVIGTYSSERFEHGDSSLPPDTPIIFDYTAKSGHFISRKISEIVQKAKRSTDNFRTLIPDGRTLRNGYPEKWSRPTSKYVIFLPDGRRGLLKEDEGDRLRW
jgi:hypothetical protein